MVWIFLLANHPRPGILGSIMETSIHIPGSLRAAGDIVRSANERPLENLTKDGFVRAWCSFAYLFPGMHPDGLHDPDNGWPRAIHRFVAEAWRRADRGELSDEELYPSDATWAGLYDRMQHHTPEELNRRERLARKEQA
jgi:hypothetical protein